MSKATKWMLRKCCDSRRGHGDPHAIGCVNHRPGPTPAGQKKVESPRRQTRRVVNYEPPDGTVIRMRKMEGRWSAAMRTPDGKEVEVDDADRFWCLDLLDGRMVAAMRDRAD